MMKSTLIKYTFGIFLFLFLLHQVILDADKIKVAVFNAKFSLLFCGLFLYLMSLLLSFRATQLLISGKTIDMPLMKIAEIYTQSLPLKYIPGGVWQSIGRANSYRKLGIHLPVIVQTIFAEQVLAIASSIFLAFTLILYMISPIVLAAFLLVVTMTVRNAHIKNIAIKLLEKVFNLINKLVKNKVNFFASQQSISFSSTRAYEICLIYFTAWFALAGAFYCYLTAVAASQIHFFVIAASYMASWAVGAMVILAPQGLGIFEGAFYFTTQLLSAATIPISIIAGYRLFIFLCDTGIWLLYCGISGTKKLS